MGGRESSDFNGRWGDPSAVIAGLDPAIHPSSQKLPAKKMDARVKRAHDDSQQ
jgi:hypothetical protein